VTERTLAAKPASSDVRALVLTIALHSEIILAERAEPRWLFSHRTGGQVQGQVEAQAMSEAVHRVSIGLPVYNGEAYIEQAIQSLLAQTFSDFELTICDNASTDGTERICRKYAALDDRIRYHRSPENLGAASNHNLTFQLSSGEFFRWAACDDLCAPELLERCVATLDAHPSAALCYAKASVINGEGVVVDSHEEGLALLSDDPVERYKGYQERFRDIGWCDPIFGLMRCEALHKTRLLGNYNSADVILLGELTLVGTIHEIPEYLFFRRIHPFISTRANPTPEALAEWFDPRSRGRIISPLWRLSREHFGAIRSSPVTGYARTRCYLRALNWLIWWAPGLGHEALGVVKAGLLRLRRRDSPGA
jgi:glycosyltransferase involved in cell wall biosynthesis